MKQNRLCMLITICFFLSVIQSTYAYRGSATGFYQGGNPTIIKIDSPKGNYYDLGFEHGRIMFQMEKDVILNIKRFINTERLYYNDMDPDYLISILEKNLPKRYKDEMKGFADGIDSIKGGDSITYKDVLFMNLIGDVTRSRLMCSAAAFRGKDGLWAGRNYDWKDGGTFHRFAGVTIFKCGKKTAASFGMTGVSSINTGLNKNGVFIAVLSAIQKKDTVFKGKDSVIFSVRYALEEAATAKQAAKILQKGEYPYSCIFMIADGKEALFLEKSGRSSAIRTIGNKTGQYLTATNHFIKMKNDRNDEDSRIRYKDMSAFLKKQNNTSGFEAVRNVLSLCGNIKHPVYIRLTGERLNKFSTLMSIILKPGTSTVFIWFAKGAPAEEKPAYTKMELKKLF